MHTVLLAVALALSFPNTPKVPAQVNGQTKVCTPSTSTLCSTELNARDALFAPLPSTACSLYWTGTQFACVTPAPFTYAQCTLPATTEAIATSSVARPAYNGSDPRSTAVTPADFNTKIVRISGEPGTSIPNTAYSWATNKGTDYTKSQPWNADESVAMIWNAISTGGSPLFVDGTTYVPIVGRVLANGTTYGGIITCPCTVRWHPTVPSWMVVVDDSGDIAWWNPVTNVWKSKYVQSGTRTGVTISANEGTLSRDGDRIMLAGVVSGTPTAWFIGNLNGTGADDVSGRKVSPDYTSANLGWDAGGAVDNGAMIAQVGNYGWISGSWTEQVMVDFTGGAAGPVVKTALASPQGHQDACVDVNGNDVSWDAGSSRMLSFVTGTVTATLTPAWGYSDNWHTSCQNFKLPGWGIGSSEIGNASLFPGEIVAVELKANGGFRRIAKHRTTLNPVGVTSYSKGPWAIPSPSGSRVMFRSDWGDTAHDADAYVVELKNSAPCGG